MITYKRKLILTKAQEQRILNWMGVCRMVYNMGLEIKITAYRNKQINVSVYDLMKQLPTIKDIDWVSDVSADVLIDSLWRLDNAYKTFFRTYKSGGGFPKFKSKRNYKSISFKNGNKGTCIKVLNNKIKVPKMGELKMFKDSPIVGKIKTAQIKVEPTGFFVCILCDEANKSISNSDESQVIGIDMGITHFATDSNGRFFLNPRHFKKYESKLRVENRSLRRKKKGSRRWEKQLRKLSLLHHKIANIRKDFLHKTSTELAKNYHAVYLEDLNIKGVSKNGKLSKSILDCGWGMFRTMLEYKTNVFAVNPNYTSQDCNECGSRSSKNRLSQSEFVCQSCGYISNADHNAAKNILSKGIALNRKSEPIGCALVEESTQDMSEQSKQNLTIKKP